jgi:hypothetical protein
MYLRNGLARPTASLGGAQLITPTLAVCSRIAPGTRVGSRCYHIVTLTLKLYICERCAQGTRSSFLTGYHMYDASGSALEHRPHGAFRPSLRNVVRRGAVQSGCLSGPPTRCAQAGSMLRTWPTPMRAAYAWANHGDSGQLDRWPSPGPSAMACQQTPPLPLRATAAGSS